MRGGIHRYSLPYIIGCKLKQNANEGCNGCTSVAGLGFKFNCMFYFTCDRSFNAERLSTEHRAPRNASAQAAAHIADLVHDRL